MESRFVKKINWVLSSLDAMQAQVNGKCTQSLQALLGDTKTALCLGNNGGQLCITFD